jgi:hypothetical protein
MRASSVKLIYISDFTGSFLPLFSRGRDHLLTSADTSVGMQYETAPFDSMVHSQWKEQMEELQFLYVSEG